MSETAQARNTRRSNRVFFGFLIGIAAVGCLFLAFLLVPHKTGIVTSVGRVGEHAWYSGVGRHKSKNQGFSADIQVRVKDSTEMVTVHYRVGNELDIPLAGEEIEFADYPLTGYGPYPQMWAVKMGALLLGADALVYGGYLIAAYRKKQKAENGSP